VVKIKNIALFSILFFVPFFLLWFLVTQPTSVKHPVEWVNKVDSKKLQDHVKILSSKLPERSDDADKLDYSAEYIFKEFSKYTSNVQYEIFSVWGIEYRNVIATFGPDNSESLYVVGAHYDSFDGQPGADDNASGVAGLLELGRIFSQALPSAKIQLAAYALEEPPYFGTVDMGSYHHAKGLRDQSINVILMISLEMIGFYSDEPESQNYPISILKLIYPDTGNYIAVVGGFGEAIKTRSFKKSMILATPLPVYSINAHPLLTGISFSDHLNFWEFNYPAIMITDTAFYRNLEYHTEKDTWQRLDYYRMSMVVQGVYQTLLLQMNNS